MRSIACERASSLPARGVPNDALVPGVGGAVLPADAGVFRRRAATARPARCPPRRSGLLGAVQRHADDGRLPFLVPTTVRDLSGFYVPWGLARCEEAPGGTRWSIPLPGDLLPMDWELTEGEEGRVAEPSLSVQTLDPPQQSRVRSLQALREGELATAAHAATPTVNRRRAGRPGTAV